MSDDIPEAVNCEECGRILAWGSPPGPAFPSMGQGGPGGSKFWCRVCRPPLGGIMNPSDWDRPPLEEDPADWWKA